MFQFSLDRAHGKYMHVQYALNTDIVVHQLKNAYNGYFENIKMS